MDIVTAQDDPEQKQKVKPVKRDAAQDDPITTYYNNNNVVASHSLLHKRN